MNFWFLIIVLGVAFLLQFILTIFQIKLFSRKYNQLSRLGRVVVGVVKGGFRSGVIVMFAIDKSGNILDGTYMVGVTILARFRKIRDFNGINIINIYDSYLIKFPKQVRRAILNAVSNYAKSLNGGEIIPPQNMYNRIMTFTN